VDTTAILHGVMVGALVHFANQANEMVLKGGWWGGEGGEMYMMKLSPKR